MDSKVREDEEIRAQIQTLTIQHKHHAGLPKMFLASASEENQKAKRNISLSTIRNGQDSKRTF